MKLEVSLEKKLGDLSFFAEFTAEGKHTGVFGPSGSGKSTLMNMLAGLVTPDSGYIYLDGEPLFDSKRNLNLPPEKRRIGVVFQHSHLFPHMNVQKNLFYGYSRVQKGVQKLDPDALIEALNLAPLLGREVNGLSGGERQRVALGRAVLSSPRLILMDESLTGLDEKLKYQIIPYLKTVFSEFQIPLLFISHSINEMQLMTKEVLEFSKGKLVGQNSTEELARKQMGSNRSGYSNLLELESPRAHNDMYLYRWGTQELMLTAGEEQSGGMFELSSKDITLFKQHPEATSARNMLNCKVRSIFQTENRIGVELDCQDQPLVSQVVSEAARDLELSPGREIFAVIKASAFRKLY